MTKLFRILILGLLLWSVPASAQRTAPKPEKVHNVILMIGDGMADEPIEALENKSPLQAVSKPAIDWVAAHGRSGMLATVPAGFAPGSEIANLSVLGYDVPKVFEGRGS